MRDVRIGILTGEASGDALAAAIVAALRDRLGSRLQIAGIGGPALAEQGLESLFPLSDLSVMGLTEVLPALPRLWRRMAEAEQAMRRLDPDVILTVDAPDFTLRVAKRLRQSRVEASRRPLLVHCVAPSVWAWRPGRAKKVARIADLLLCLLPFEPDWFTPHGLEARFIGHPLVAGPMTGGEAQRFRLSQGLPAEGAPQLLGVLPGSRKGEVTRLLPLFAEAVGLLAETVPGVEVVIPVVPQTAALVRDGVRGWRVPVRVVDLVGQAKADCFRAMDAAIAASGTVSVELAAARVPHLIAYRVSAVSAFIVRRLISVPFVNLINLLLHRPVIREFLQEQAEPAAIAREAARLLGDPGYRAAQRAAMDDGLALLGQGGPPPAGLAAAAILEWLAARE